MKTIDIHGKPYVMVKDRIDEFHKNNPNGSITTEVHSGYSKDFFIVKAVVIPDIKNEKRIFTGHAMEEIGSSQINKTSCLENAETSAIGRALGALNIGIIDSYASANEVANAIHQQENTKPVSEPTIYKDSNTNNTDIQCIKCGSSMFNNKQTDGQPKKSQNYDVYIKEGKTKGLYQPLYKCSNRDCKHSLWDEPDVMESRMEDDDGLPV